MKRENTKAAPDGANIQSGKETAVTGIIAAPTPDSNTRARAGQGIVGLIPHGAQNAITGAELCKLMNCGPREVTRAIQAARLHGAPICSSTGEVPGYYLTDDPGELGRYIKSLDHRTREMTATREALAVTMDGMSGQDRMEGF